MDKLYQSLQLLNYNLKKTFNPPAIQIIENEKYVANNNEYKDRLMSNDENSDVTRNCKNSDIHNDPNCKIISTRSCETLCYPLKKTPGTQNIFRDWNQNNEDELAYNDSEFSLDYPLRNGAESRKLFKIPHKSRISGLVQKHSDTKLDYPLRNMRDNNKSFKNLNCKTDKLVEYNSHTSLEYPLTNITENKKSLKNLYKNIKDGQVKNNSDKNLDYHLNIKTEKKKSFENLQTNNTAEELLQNDSEESLGYPLQNTTNRRKTFRELYRKSRDELLHKGSHLSTKLNETDMKMKMTSAHWNFPSRSVKQLQNKTQPNRVNIPLLDKVKIVENPKYFPEYALSEKEEKLFQDKNEKKIFQLQSSIDSSEKLQKYFITCQESPSLLVRDVKSIYSGIDETEQLLPNFESLSWEKNNSDMQNFALESKGAQNISGERQKTRDKKKQIQNYPKELNPFDSDEDIFASEKDP